MMRNLLFILAVALLIGWALSVFVWSVGGMIHMLIVLAIIAFLLGLIRNA